VSKRALGKGLDALIQSGESTKPEAASATTVPIGSIDPSTDQPRKHFDATRLEELAESIRHQGIIQPIVLEAKGSRYAIVAGERRYRAAKLAGLTEVPAVVARYGSEKRLMVSLIENLQREDLDPIEEAEAYRRLLEDGPLNQEELAQQIGKNRTTIANSLRLLNLSDEVKAALQTGEISPGHARALLSVVDEDGRAKLFRQVRTDGLSVREAEELARLQSEPRKTQSKKKRAEKQRPPEIQDLEQQFIEALGTKVRITGSAEKGTLEISYFSKDDLQRLYDLLIDE
jgi:ParB family chromosome partitioning protein